MYFPINFTPPPNNPFNVTPEDLKEALHTCLTCSGHLSHITVPFMLDKLTSDIPETNLDCLEVIRALIRSPFNMDKHIDPIVSILTNQYFDGSNPDVLRSLRSVLSETLSKVNK